jgi:hypothetical protein
MLDGKIQLSPTLESALLRTPDGHMISLTYLSEAVSEPEKPEELDPRQQEIRRILDSLKL